MSLRLQLTLLFVGACMVLAVAALMLAELLVAVQ